MHTPSRFWIIPPVAAVFAALVGVHTRIEQDRQFESVRVLYEAHAGFVGSLVRESAQEATWATDLVYTMSAEGTRRMLDLLGTARPDDCEAARRKADDLVVWATLDAGGMAGCFGPVPEARRAAFLQSVLGAPDPGFVDTAQTQEFGVFCSSAAADGRVTVLCRDRARLDRMRREVGLGPLLSSLKGRELKYVVLQDAAGILAASPRPGTISTWADDPALKEALDGPIDRLTSRVIERADGPVFEAVGSLTLGDGTRAIVRTGLDASGLQELRERIGRQQAVMAVLLGAFVVLCLILAGVLAWGDRRRREHLEALRRREEEGRHWHWLGEMAATVAHEVRSPLNTIGITAQRLRAEFHVPPDERDEFDALLRLSAAAQDRVERVVTDFLELGKPLVLQLEPCEAAAVLGEELAPMVLRAERESRTLEIDRACREKVRVDRRRLGQVLVNLVANAMDAVPVGGRVRVTGECAGADLVVRISDDGPGMDVETLSRVQAPFVTTKGHGTGLGLPLAKRLVEAHGGTLSIASDPGRGTTVTIRLPKSGRA